MLFGRYASAQRIFAQLGFWPYKKKDLVRKRELFLKRGREVLKEKISEDRCL